MVHWTSHHPLLSSLFWLLVVILFHVESAFQQAFFYSSWVLFLTCAALLCHCSAAEMMRLDAPIPLFMRQHSWIHVSKSTGSTWQLKPRCLDVPSLVVCSAYTPLCPPLYSALINLFYPSSPFTSFVSDFLYPLTSYNLSTRRCISVLSLILILCLTLKRPSELKGVKEELSAFSCP